MECSEGFAELYSIRNRLPTPIKFSNRADTTIENLKISRIVMKIGPPGLIGILVYSKSTTAKYKIWGYQSGEASTSTAAIRHTSSLVKAFNILIQNNTYDLNLHLPRLLLDAHQKVKNEESVPFPHTEILKKELNVYTEQAKKKTKKKDNRNVNDDYNDDSNSKNTTYEKNNDSDNNNNEKSKNDVFLKSPIRNRTYEKNDSTADNTIESTDIETVENLIFKKGKNMLKEAFLRKNPILPQKLIAGTNDSKVRSKAVEGSGDPDVDAEIISLWGSSGIQAGLLSEHQMDNYNNYNGTDSNNSTYDNHNDANINDSDNNNNDVNMDIVNSDDNNIHFPPIKILMNKNKNKNINVRNTKIDTGKQARKVNDTKDSEVHYNSLNFSSNNKNKTPKIISYSIRKYN